VTLEVRAADLPIFEGVAAIAARNRSGGLASNQEYFGGWVAVDPAVAPELAAVLFDPQTSGGLLVSAPEGAVEQVEAAFGSAGVQSWRIGRVVPSAGDTRVRVV
jgi:selenide,water dikinase